MRLSKAFSIKTRSACFFTQDLFQIHLQILALYSVQFLKPLSPQGCWTLGWRLVSWRAVWPWCLCCPPSPRVRAAAGSGPWRHAGQCTLCVKLGNAAHRKNKYLLFIYLPTNAELNVTGNPFYQCLYNFSRFCLWSFNVYWFFLYCCDWATPSTGTKFVVCIRWCFWLFSVFKS